MLDFGVHGERIEELEQVTYSFPSADFEMIEEDLKVCSSYRNVVIRTVSSALFSCDVAYCTR